MSGSGEAEKAHLDALMVRMLAGLLLLGAGLLLCLLLVLLALPQVEGPDGMLVLLPGTHERHGISAIVLPVLGAATLLLGLPGLLALGLGRRQARFGNLLRARAGASSFRRPALVLLGGLALLAVVLLRR